MQLGVKLSGRLSVGAGGVYRIGISDKFERWAQGLRIYGYRGYSDVEIVKGLFLHAEIEQLKMEAFTHAKARLEQKARRNTNFNVGVGKRYALSKKVNGSVLVFYRAELKGHLPAVNKVNFRIGIDLNTKKQKKVD